MKEENIPVEKQIQCQELNKLKPKFHLEALKHLKSFNIFSGDALAPVHLAIHRFVGKPSVCHAAAVADKDDDDHHDRDHNSGNGGNENDDDDEQDDNDDQDDDDDDQDENDDDQDDYIYNDNVWQYTHNYWFSCLNFTILATHDLHHVAFVCHFR